MDSIKSFKGYGKVDPVDEQAFRQKTRKCLLLLLLSVLLLLAIIIGAVLGTVLHKNNSPSSPPTTSSAAALKSLCSPTPFPDSCYFSISALESPSNAPADPEE